MSGMSGRIFFQAGWLALLLAVPAAWAQDNGDTPAPPPASAPQNTAPANPPMNTIDNPPISGLDVPSLEPENVPKNFWQPALHFSESADTNVQSTLGSGGAFKSVTRALGSLALQREWNRDKLVVEYEGGAAYYNDSNIGVRSIQQLDVEQRVGWQRGHFGIHNSFNYLPEGTFGAAYGSLNGLGGVLSGGASPVFFGGGPFGTLGQVPRIMNLTLADVEEDLSPKSSLTVAVGYGILHFTGNGVVIGTTPIPVNLINNSQVTVQAGYSRVLGPHDQAALVYGYQGFDFEATHLAFHSHVAQLMWGHRISGGMDLLVGIGPQITQLSQSGIQGTTVGAAGRASLRYRFPKTSLHMSYDHYNTAGSGFFAGQKSDVLRLGAERPLSRLWSMETDAGYAYSQRLQLTGAGVGVNASSYGYGFAGAALHRMFTRNLHGYVSYQFDDLYFNAGPCVMGVPCQRMSQRHVATVGIDWTPKPIRID
jgi:hypothetical protein